MWLSADDCLLCRETKSLNDYLAQQSDFKQLELWAQDWGMKFKAKECCILSVKNKMSFYDSLDNEFLERVQSNPYLGFRVADLKWNTHITAIVKKANITLGFPRRNLRHSPPPKHTHTE